MSVVKLVHGIAEELQRDMAELAKAQKDPLTKEEIAELTRVNEKIGAEAFLLAAREVISDEHRQFYAKEHDGASLDAALAWETCTASGVNSVGTSAEDQSQVQDPKALPQVKWFMARTSPDQREEIKSRMVMHVKALKAKATQQ